MYLDNSILIVGDRIFTFDSERGKMTTAIPIHRALDVLKNENIRNRQDQEFYLKNNMKKEELLELEEIFKDFKVTYDCDLNELLVNYLKFQEQDRYTIT